MKTIAYSSIYYLIYGQNFGSIPIVAAPAAISKGLVGIHPLLQTKNKEKNGHTLHHHLKI
jgi:hypothetical protein